MDLETTERRAGTEGPENRQRRGRNQVGCNSVGVTLQAFRFIPSDFELSLTRGFRAVEVSSTDDCTGHAGAGSQLRRGQHCFQLARHRQAEEAHRRKVHLFRRFPPIFCGFLLCSGDLFTTFYPAKLDTPSSSTVSLPFRQSVVDREVLHFELFLPPFFLPLLFSSSSLYNATRQYDSLQCAPSPHSSNCSFSSSSNPPNDSSTTA